MKTTTIARTKKGSRIWLEGLSASGWWPGTRFTTVITPRAIRHVRLADGKRSVRDSKGGIIDTTSKKVERWAQGAERANITIETHAITITRAS